MRIGRAGYEAISNLDFICSCEQDKPVIHVFDGRGEDKEITFLDKLHSSPITFMEVGENLQ